MMHPEILAMFSLSQCVRLGLHLDYHSLELCVQLCSDTLDLMRLVVHGLSCLYMFTQVPCRHGEMLAF